LAYWAPFICGGLVFFIGGITFNRCFRGSLNKKIKKNCSRVNSTEAHNQNIKNIVKIIITTLKLVLINAL